MLNKLLSKFKKDQRGVTAIEYGLIAVAMAVLLGTVMSSTGDKAFIAKLKTAFETVASQISTSTTAPTS